MRKKSAKTVKIVELWDSNLTIKENSTKLESVGVKTNVSNLYLLAKNNNLGFKVIRPRISASTNGTAVQKTESVVGKEGVVEALPTAPVTTSSDPVKTEPEQKTEGEAIAPEDTPEDTPDQAPGTSGTTGK